MPKTKEKRGTKLLYVKANSVEDIARFAYNPESISKNLICSKHDSEIMLVALGEHIGDNIIAYYTDIKSEPMFVRYVLPTEFNEEKAVLIEHGAETDKNSIFVLRTDLTVFGEIKNVDSEDIMLLRVGHADDIVNAVAMKVAHEEHPGTLYVFEKAGKAYIAGFDLVDELSGDRKTFYYAPLKDMNRRGFIKYNYKDSTFVFSDSIDEHTYIYLKVLNLSEAFPFFKLPD